MDIEKQLLEVTKITRAKGEGEQKFLRRLFDKANTLSDDQWESLDEVTQKWVNAAMTAVEEKTAIPLFDGTLPTEAEKESTVAKKKVGKAGANGGAAATPTASKKAAPKKAAPKKAAASGGETRGRKGLYPPNAKIAVKVKENPHRESSKDYGKFKGLKNGMTIEKAVAAGVDLGYIRYAASRELIAVEA